MALGDEERTAERKPIVLIVDDEPQIIEFLHMGFGYEGFSVCVARTGLEALQAVTAQHPDIVILDVMLPSLNGLEVARQIRKAHDTCIIMLTAKEDVEDRVAGLDMGADDYVTKPFVFKELMARVRAVLRRRGDADQLRRVFLNIVENALKFTPVPGRVELKVSSDCADVVTVEICDTGIGIPQEVVPHVFDRFYRVDPSRMRSSSQGGSGLGLSIAQGLVNAHGGTICMSSVPGQGAKVTMGFPAVKAREDNV